MRQYLARVGLILVGSVGLGRTCAADAVKTGFRQPAEFEPQAAVWLCADPNIAEFKTVTAAMAKALMPHVKVKMIAETDDTLAQAKATLKEQGVDPGKIEFLVDPLDTYFMRDAAVYLINDRGDMALLDLKWSDYGLPGWGQRLHPNDPEKAAKLATQVNTAADAFEQVLAKATKATVVSSPLFLENATFEVNGRGVLLISEPLALERNPGLSRAQIEQHLLAIPGVKKVIWLAEGVAEDPLEIATIEGDYVGMGAGGHTDEFVRFADARTILLAWQEPSDEGQHPLHRINHERMKKNLSILEQATDQDGKPFRVIKVPLPAVIERTLVLAPTGDPSTMWHNTTFPAAEGRKAGQKVKQVAAATYLNFVIANEVVLLPSYVEDGTDPTLEQRVGVIFKDAFPGRTLQFIRCAELNFHGGGLHCATLSEPKR